MLSRSTSLVKLFYKNLPDQFFFAHAPIHFKILPVMQNENDDIISHSNVSQKGSYKTINSGSGLYYILLILIF